MQPFLPHQHMHQVHNSTQQGAYRGLHDFLQLVVGSEHARSVGDDQLVAVALVLFQRDVGVRRSVRIGVLFVSETAALVALRHVGEDAEDAVACGLWLGADDAQLLLQQPVQQCRLARVRIS